MIARFHIAATILLIVIQLTLSCKKELSCEGCKENNKPPIAIAGPDQVITLPTDSISLDGSASNDSDGTISEWLWKKISGPASFNIINTTIAKTSVENLNKGVYQFELKVTDNKNLSATDTVQVVVNDASQLNRPPVANAGPDQTITLPNNSINLDGNASSDPDNNITTYLWTKISGPSSTSINNANAVQTQVTDLIEGIYYFELKVNDAGGLSSNDTMQVRVQSVVVSPDCNGVIRNQVTAQLLTIGNLSLARLGIAVASANNKILFAGGVGNSFNPNYQVYSRVDIYDISTNTWSVAELSQPRTNIATAVLNNKIYFAGGEGPNFFSSRVDIYDAINNSWTTAELSQPRSHLSGAAAGNKVLFAGGYGATNSAPPVDILDITTNTWTVDSLRNRPTINMIGDAGIAATAIGNKIYFAGNASDWMGWDFGSITSVINIYDVSNNTWATTDLSISRGFMASIAIGNKNYWAGGVNNQSNNFTNLVEIRDKNTGISTFSCLSRPNAFFSAVQKNNQLIYFTLGPNMPVMWPNSIWQNTFDIYDIPTSTWSIGVLPYSMGSTQIISVNNVIYLAGGIINESLTNKVWKLEF